MGCGVTSALLRAVPFISSTGITTFVAQSPPMEGYGLMDVPAAHGWLFWAPLVAQGEKQSPTSGKIHHSPLCTLHPGCLICVSPHTLSCSSTLSHCTPCPQMRSGFVVSVMQEKLSNYMIIMSSITCSKTNFFDSFSQAADVHTKAKSQSRSSGHRYIPSHHFPPLLIHSTADFSPIPSLPAS